MSSIIDVRDGTHDTPNYVTNGYPLITGKDFYKGFFDLSKTQYINYADFERINQRSIVEVGDILFSMIGGNIGSQILITEDNYFEMAIKNVALFKNYAKDLIDEQYLFYFLQSRVYDFKAIANGGAQSFVSLKQLRSYLVPIPGKSEQFRISKTLNNILSITEKYEILKGIFDKLNNTILINLRKSILQEAIQGRLVPQIELEGTAEELLGEIRAEKVRLVKEGKLKKSAIANESRIFRGDDNKYYLKDGNELTCIDEDIPFEIPSTWSWVRLDDICTYIQRGKSPKYSLIKKIPVVAQKCNQWSGFQIEKVQFIEPSSLASYGEERLLQDDDLMWNSTGLGTLGRMAIYKYSLNPFGIAVADSHITVIRPIKEKVLSEYLYAYFSSNTVQSVIEDKSDGSTKQKELSTTTVKKYLVPLPPFTEQQRIIAKLNEILASIMSR